MRSICVYCSSSDAVATSFFEAASEMGARIAARGYTLIYGGADVGLMGALAHNVHDHGGHVIGVVPETLQGKAPIYDAADELIVTRDLRERKAVMMARADAFVVLPGGFGTLEESLETLTLRQLNVHTKPVVFLNVLDFYAPIVAVFEHFYRERFAKPVREMYYLAPDVPSVFTYLDQYTPAVIPDKLFRMDKEA